MSALLARARGWLGTPFQDGQAAQGAGADCVGFLASVCAPALGPDWAAPEGRSAQAWLAAAMARLVEKPVEAAAPGDLLVFAPTPHGAPTHAGLMVAPALFLHAHWRAGVIESSLTAWWRARLVRVFALAET
jgi:NlpC/P60 family putative phage cell wall peptidase